MHPLPFQEQSYVFGECRLRLLVPDLAAIKEQHQRGLEENSSLPFPYWAKVWPAAVGLCNFIAEHSELLLGKKVVEIASGLGLPSILAAQWAAEVLCTEKEKAALFWVAQSAKANGCTNLRTAVADWNNRTELPEADVLLLSDINYDHKLFDVLFSLLSAYIATGTVVLLSTPQRLMAKPFLFRLLPWCAQQQNTTVKEEHGTTEVSVYVLREL